MLNNKTKYKICIYSHISHHIIYTISFILIFTQYTYLRVHKLAVSIIYRQSYGAKNPYVHSRPSQAAYNDRPGVLKQVRVRTVLAIPRHPTPIRFSKSYGPEATGTARNSHVTKAPLLVQCNAPEQGCLLEAGQLYGSPFWVKLGIIQTADRSLKYSRYWHTSVASHGHWWDNETSQGGHFPDRQQLGCTKVDWE